MKNITLDELKRGRFSPQRHYSNYSINGCFLRIYSGWCYTLTKVNRQSVLDTYYDLSKFSYLAISPKKHSDRVKLTLHYSDHDDRVYLEPTVQLKIELRVYKQRQGNSGHYVDATNVAHSELIPLTPAEHYDFLLEGIPCYVDMANNGMGDWLYYRHVQDNDKVLAVYNRLTNGLAYPFPDKECINRPTIETYDILRRENPNFISTSVNEIKDIYGIETIDTLGRYRQGRPQISRFKNVCVAEPEVLDPLDYLLSKPTLHSADLYDFCKYVAENPQRTRIALLTNEL